MDVDKRTLQMFVYLVLHHDSVSSQLCPFVNQNILMYLFKWLKIFIDYY
jgi:hypothetical protein